MHRCYPLIAVVMLLAACGGAPQVVSVATVPPPTDIPATPTTAVPPTTASTPTIAPSPTPAMLTTEEIAEKLRSGTLLVKTEFNVPALQVQGLGGGTGIFYDKANGYILTNAHVVEGASSIQVAQAKSDRAVSARIMGRSECDDLTVLKVSNTNGLEPLKLGDSDTSKQGADVVALGYPQSFQLGNDLTVTTGSISKLHATQDKLEDLIQTNTAITHGNSGGPLVNHKGEVIGVNTRGFITEKGEREPGINFAIAISQAKPIIKQLESGKSLLFTGLNLYPNVFEKYFGTKEGLVVVGVASGSPASQIGVQPADLLVKMEGAAVNSEEDVCKILRSHADGDQIKVMLLRGNVNEGALLEGEMTLGKTGAADDKTRKLIVTKELKPAQPTAAPAKPTAPPAKPPAATAQGGQSGGTGNSNIKTIFETQFPNGDTHFPTGETDSIKASVEGGKYRVAVKTADRFLPLPSDASFKDGAISSEVVINGDTQAYAGLIIRYTKAGDNAKMYVCFITNAGMFGCSKLEGGNPTALVAPKQSAAIKQNAKNRITLVAIGDQLLFQINEQDVADFKDGSLTSGEAGFYVENFKNPVTIDYTAAKVVTTDK
ncbi:MAG: hypothetical protein NVS2B7_08670 [Herpetosiphon sp.]